MHARRAVRAVRGRRRAATLLVTDAAGDAIAAVELAGTGETAVPATPGAVGAAGPPGPTGAAGSARGRSGSGRDAWAAGSQGAAGSPGEAGPAGKRGPRGRAASVSCRIAGKQRVRCTVRYASGTRAKGSTNARLVRGGRTYATGRLSALRATRKLTRGAYTLRIGRATLRARVGSAACPRFPPRHGRPRVRVGSSARGRGCVTTIRGWQGTSSTTPSGPRAAARPRRVVGLSRGFLAAVLLAGITAAPAAAAPVDVHVRVEGEQPTLFDRVVRTDGHDVKSASDTAPRRCDGTNNGANPTPGPTATAATVDAMTTIGQGFDGQWYPGFDDYFLTRWGPDAEDNGKAWWWGILVNRVFTPVGGCQFRVQSGDEVLWVYDAFSSRRFLWLAAPPTTTVGAPTTVTVTSTASSTSRRRHRTGRPIRARSSPGSASMPSRRRRTRSQPGTSDAAGKAVVVFQRPGWQRLKARHPQPGEHPVAIASNSVDVCVHAADGSGCDGPPPSQIPVSPGGPIRSRHRRRRPPRPRRPPRRRRRAHHLADAKCSGSATCRPSPRRCGSRRRRSLLATA